MLTSYGPGAIPPVSRSKVSYTGIERENRVQVTKGGHYDSVSLSAVPNGESSFYRELVGRLSQDVRTATTTGDIRALREEVSSGQYVPDARVIAARMLLMEKEL